MGKVIVIKEPGQVGFDEFDDRPLAANEARIQTLYSGVSAGTELTAYRGSNPYLHKFWDEQLRLFRCTDQTTKTWPMIAFGYEECGQVSEVGAAVSKIKRGDWVYGTWGHRTETIVTEDFAATRLLPSNLDPVLGIFSQITAIALNGILDAAIRIGETVAVFGLGTPGQIAAQLAKHSGARVIGVDLSDFRLRLAQQLGAIDIAINANAGQVAEQIKSQTSGRGADVCLEVSGSYPALHEAIRSAAYSAKVVALGFFQGYGEGLYLGEEFHHNRINVVCSQISGIDPSLTYRWNRDRLVQTGIRLQAEGVLNLKPLITHVIPFEQAADAYRIVDTEAENVLQVVLNLSPNGRRKP
ncbi:MAG: zinc-binding alcohol dehydrogenase [Chloroflexi bacterium]|nr:zinc-binding alcohol dehydrogenase [Chloroflexota bacterium]